jgi:hypothetical protein
MEPGSSKHAASKKAAPANQGKQAGMCLHSSLLAFLLVMM